MTNASPPERPPGLLEWLGVTDAPNWRVAGATMDDVGLAEAKFSESDLSIIRGLTPEQPAQAFGAVSVSLPGGAGTKSADRPAHWPIGWISYYDDTEYRKWLASPSTYVPPAP